MVGGPGGISAALPSRTRPRLNVCAPVSYAQDRMIDLKEAVNINRLRVAWWEINPQ